MKIYTKAGDQGSTTLFGGQKVSKTHLRIETYGTLDELNAHMGLVLTDERLPSMLRNACFVIQNELFQLGAELATPSGKTSGIALIGASQVEFLERSIDEMEASLPPLRTFILPGGSVSSTRLHIARTVARQAKRAAVTLTKAKPIRPKIVQYLNRLSDFLFVAARFANAAAKINDLPWNPPRQSPGA